MRRIEFFEQKGLQWNTEALMFSTLTMVLFNSEPMFFEANSEIVGGFLNFGANMTQFRSSYELGRKSLIYINTRNDSNLINNNDKILNERIKRDFDIGEYITFVKRIRNNNMSHNIATRYMKKLARDLQISNGKLKLLISLVGKYPSLPMSQQIDTLYKLRNYSSLNYRSSKYSNLYKMCYNDIVEKYGNDTTYTNNKKGDNMSNNNDNNNEELTGLALLTAIAAGTYKMTKAMTGLYKPRKESWAQRIAGKAEHRGFDDQYRH